MKTISSALSEHLKGPTTSLATLWRITRVDGEEFFFTDHDVDITFESNTYLSSAGYVRSAVDNKLGLSVDNLETTGFLDSDSLSESELRAGLFDFAEVKISVVNWKDISQGEVKIRRGKLGEVVYSEITGMFRAELRGLTQLYSQKPIELFQAECRASLGDSRCKVNLEPDLVTAETTYALKDFVVENTTNPVENSDVAIVNGGFDTGDLTGWTTVSGSPLVQTDSSGLLPYEGTHFLEGDGSVDFEITQTVALSASQITAIQGGDYNIAAEAFRANSSNSDQARVLVEALDSLGSVVATVLDTGFEAISPIGSWVERTASIASPTSVEQIKVTIQGKRLIGSIVNSATDSVFVGLFEDPPTGEQPSAELEGRIYEVTAAGKTDNNAERPVFDTTLGAETTWGGATFTAREAWTHHAEVTAVTDNRNFTVSYTVAADSREVDDWFRYGAVNWQTGNNAGLVMEVKSSNATSATLELFLEMPFDVQVGDELTVYAGCDKRLNTCINKFDNVLNFRGEPYVPGQDELMQYPDAR